MWQRATTWDAVSWPSSIALPLGHNVTHSNKQTPFFVYKEQQPQALGTFRETRRQVLTEKTIWGSRELTAVVWEARIPWGREGWGRGELEPSDVCGLMGVWRECRRWWDLISLEGWAAGLCADREEGQMPSRCIFLLTLHCYVAGASGGQHLHSSSGAQLSFEINLLTCVISEKNQHFFSERIICPTRGTFLFPVNVQLISWDILFIYSSHEDLILQWISAASIYGLILPFWVSHCCLQDDPAEMWMVYYFSLPLFHPWELWLSQKAKGAQERESKLIFVILAAFHSL